MQTSSKVFKLPLPAELGYDLAADCFDEWHWTDFWRHNEIPLVRTLISRISPDSLLDAGSGTGTYRFQMEQSVKLVLAVDISRKMLGVQLSKAASSNCRHDIPVLRADIRKLPNDWSRKFDCIICARVLSNIADADTAIKELSRVLKPRGHLIITDVDPRHDYSEVKIANGVIHSSIQAFKHSRDEMEKSFVAHGLFTAEQNTFRLDDLKWLPPKARFGKLYAAPERPIFFIYDLVKGDSQ